MQAREIIATIQGQPASDGAGVRLNRVISFQRELDPFLMLDEFNSDQADDYIAGFPSHPHRGFETVTYMLDGRMLHEDHLGNQGLLVSGAVQWMTAGRGIIHSEMPQQEEGRMRGFQLWLNLPAAEKMKPAAYRDIPPEAIPVFANAQAQVKVVAGRFVQGETVVEGAVRAVSTQPLYLDIDLQPQAELVVPVEPGHTVLLYVFDGALQVTGRSLTKGHLARLGKGDQVQLAGGEQGGRALLLAARPLGEPVAHYGPFVMNTMDEIKQAIDDYNHGRLTD
ncbi:MAG: pirin family protein [Chromatiales bacterium]|nr:pirin family protein [Gammaproteobacteria bacterium]MBW6477713.1 pirin family protein [Chromatiales bacterium]